MQRRLAVMWLPPILVAAGPCFAQGDATNGHGAHQLDPAAAARTDSNDAQGVHGAHQDDSAPAGAHRHDPAPALPSSDVLGDIRIDFSLVDAQGGILSDEDFRGRYMLVGFGFTRCTDVCPLMAANMAIALRAAERDAVGIFVSVDTERDDPARTHAYASAFGERMMGLGGTHEQVAEAARNFKVSFAVTKTQSDYTVQHSSHLFLVDTEGELVDVFALNSNPNAVAEAMKHR